MKHLLLSALLAATIGATQAQPASFATISTYSTGSRPNSIVVADVNADGKLDLLTANQGSSEAGVLLGTGTGSFGAATAYSTGTGSEPTGIAVADVNRDGKLDLVTANFANSTVGVLLGTGSGTFGAATAFSTGSGSQPYGVVVADVDKDGKPDLLTANFFNNTLGMLLGTGTGSFETVQTYYAGINTPTCIVAADLNAYGRLDVLMGNYSAKAGIFINTSSPSSRFEPVMEVRVCEKANTFSIAVADVNQDGKLDLITANRSDNGVGVLLGKGKGNFEPVTAYGTGMGSQPMGVAVADVNGDGKLDLITANYGSDSIGVLLGVGNGTFGAATILSTGGGGSQPRAIAAADVNGDGRPDLLIANVGSNTTGVLLNTGTYTPLAAPAGLAAAAATLTPNPASGTATFSGIAPGQLVQVYDALGRLALTTQAGTTGTASLALPAGLYLVRSGAGPALRLVVE